MTDEAREESVDAEMDRHVTHCSSCGCKMDISAMEPYTKVICPDCGHRTRVKRELGQYLLTGRHAVGGMSKVFKALDTTLDREVAIKILNEEYSRDEQRMKKFEHEALITAAISHPHVVRVFTVGKAYGHFYIAMEMVSGENLEQWISREGAIREDRILPLAGQIISGLQAAKQAGLIHRDMKPGNILFDANGHVKIVDFGLALVTQGGMAKADEIWATPYYVPPEALDGQEEDFRSDMYALGATLYHALAGHPSIPEDAKSSLAVRKAKEKVEPLAMAAPWLKQETCHLVDKAMEFKPKNRFESYAEMEDVRALAYRVIEEKGAEEPMHSRDRAKRRAKEKITVVVLAAVAFVALFLLLAFIIFKTNDEEADKASAGNVAYPMVGIFPEHESTYSPEVAARIGKQFHISHQMLKKGRYGEARSVFLKLMNDQQVNEPAASWAGVEAVIAAWLAGDTRGAGAALEQLQKHMEARGVPRQSPIRKLADRLGRHGTITQAHAGENAMKVVHMMAVALKNWETGGWDIAVRMFKEIRKQEMPEDSPLIVYREIAEGYLTDYGKLQPLAAQTLPADLKLTHERMATLKAMAGQLQTSGRARFYLGVWQLRMQRHAQKLEQRLREATEAKNQKPELPAYQAQLPKFHQLVSRSKFAEAADSLRKVRIEKNQQKERDAWIYLVSSANSFIHGIESKLANKALTMELVTVDSKSYQGIVSAKPGGLLLMGESGEVFVLWVNLEPESVLEVYKEVFELNLNTLPGQKHTEEAVCYAWLMGMQDKASLAAGKLASANSNFQKRWANTMQAQGQTP